MLYECHTGEQWLRLIHHLIDPGREGHPGTEGDGDRSAVAPHQVDVW